LHPLSLSGNRKRKRLRALLPDYTANSFCRWQRMKRMVVVAETKLWTLRKLKSNEGKEEVKG
jgi:hypothetical protein